MKSTKHTNRLLFPLKIRTIFLAFWFSMVCVGCNQNTKKNASKTEEEIKLITNSDFRDVNLSTVFKNVKTIPLKNNSKGAKSIDKVLFNAKRIYILDKDLAKGVFEYDHEGHFIRQIGQIGKGPGEYTDISDFDLYDHTISISSHPDIINLYDKAGNHLERKHLNFQFSSFIAIKNGYLFFNNYRGAYGGDQYYNVIKTNENFKFLEGFFPYDQSMLNSNVVSYPSEFTRTSDSNVLFNNPLTNEIHIYSDNFFKKTILFKFSENPIPNDFFDSNISPEKLINIFQGGYSMLSYPFYTSSKYSFFEVSIKGLVKYVVETPEKKYKISNYSDDLIGIPYYKFLGVCNDQLIGTIDWGRTVQAMDEPTSSYNNQSDIKAKLDNFLATNSLDPMTAEPVLVLFNFK